MHAVVSRASSRSFCEVLLFSQTVYDLNMLRKRTLWFKLYTERYGTLRVLYTVQFPDGVRALHEAAVF